MTFRTNAAIAIKDATTEQLGVSRQAMSSLLNGRADISAEIAVKFEEAFGLKAVTLLRMQVVYDLSEALSRGGQPHCSRARAQTCEQQHLSQIL